MGNIQISGVWPEGNCDRVCLVTFKVNGGEIQQSKLSPGPNEDLLEGLELMLAIRKSYAHEM